MAYVSWFNKIRTGLLRKGIVIDGKKHIASPIKDGESWKRGKCPKCESENGFIFRSHTDGNVYICFCHKCNKFSVRQTTGVKTNPDGSASFTGPLVGMGF